MSVSTICPGCGSRVQPPTGYQRRKIQCSACGVMCELPERVEERVTASEPASRNVSTAAARPTVEDPPGRSDRAAHETATGEVTVQACRVCGESVRVAASADSKPSHCPVCGSVVVIPLPSASRPPQKKPKKPRPPSAPVAPPVRSESSGSIETEEAYTVRDKTKPCPDCARAMPLEASLCTGCGYNFETGETPAPKVYERVERHWDSGLPYRRRMKIFIAGESLFCLLGLPVALLAAEFVLFLSALVPFTVMLSFLLGTFASLDLRRSERGRVQLWKTWRLCFWTWSTTKIDCRHYEGIQVGMANDVDIWDWMIFLQLLVLGIVPGIFWWNYMIRPNTYYVALCRDHGYPECMLYRGKNEPLARELADTLHETTGLPPE